MAGAADSTDTTDSPDTVHGFPVDELIDDFRLACVSRAIDDREISMQKQSRVFFQISGAGHEALGLALARHAPGLRLVLPVLPRPGARPRPRGHAEGDPPAGGRLGRGPGHGWPPDAEPLGPHGGQPGDPVQPHGQPVHPGRGSAEAARYIVRRPELGLPAHGDELTYVSLGEACSEGEFWESLNTACNLHLPVLYVVPDNGFAISVPTTDQQPAPVADLVAGFQPRSPSPRRNRLLLHPASHQGRDRPHPGRRGTSPPALRCRPAVFPLGGRHAGQVPLGRGAGGRSPAGPHRPDGAHAGGARCPHGRARGRAEGRGQGDRRQGCGRGAGRGPARPRDRARLPAPGRP